MASSVTVHTAFAITNLLFLILACHFSLFLAFDASPDHDHYQCKVDGEILQYGIELPTCMIPKRAPKPPSSDNALVPWDRNYVNLYTPVPNGGLVVRSDGMHADLRITSVNQSFGHFQSKYRFVFGYFSMNLKLIPKQSAGVIATYYFSSPETKPKESDRHDEMDFEFLGNTSGNPITLQTNVYLNGVGNREQHHYLSFDPTAAFHKYSLLWNQHLIIWFVDDKVIRVFHNKTQEVGVPFPVNRPMAVQCSIWDGSDWATQGGRVKLNYTYAPFVAQYEGFGGVDGCQACPATPSTACDTADLSPCSDAKKYWFLEQQELTAKQIKQLQKHQKKYIVYDYCTDAKRFPEGMPEECRYNKFY
ncbi:hypothetical protein M758_7G094500 [Ceratodon purpureus]|nr:hypothetical protein M758_7G094500 [Ceratodon purpureus]